MLAPPATEVADRIERCQGVGLRFDAEGRSAAASTVVPLDLSADLFLEFGGEAGDSRPDFLSSSPEALAHLIR